MRNFLKNIITGCIGILLVTVIVYSLFKNNDFLPDSNIWKNTNTQDNHTSTQNKDDSIQKSVDMSNEVSTFGMTYKVNNIKRTKQRGPLPLTNIYDFLLLDDQGTIKNNYSYLIFNLSIRNDLESEQEITLNSYTIYGKNSQDVYTLKLEPMLFDKRTDVEKRDYFHFTLQPKEEVTFNLGYIAEDKSLEEYKNHMDFIINNGGTSNFSDKDVRIIKIAY
jgi:hypothetical protein